MDEPAKKMSGTTLLLDLNDPCYRTLSGYAGRIQNLLRLPAVSANPELAGSIDDLLGVVYALIQANHNQFKDRDRPINIAPVAQRAGRIASGHVRTDGQWIAGFYFNNALFRSAAVYQRILKIVVGNTRDDVPTLQTKAIALYSRWVSIKLHKVYTQVNELKHDPQGIYSARLVTYQDVLTAIGDLFDLIEAWNTANAPPVATP